MESESEMFTQCHKSEKNIAGGQNRSISHIIEKIIL
jgi:hypothetical protein